MPKGDFKWANRDRTVVEFVEHEGGIMTVEYAYRMTQEQFINDMHSLLIEYGIVRNARFKHRRTI